MHIALPQSRMGGKPPPSEQQLGFLGAGRDPALGYMGGYLITTARGRPLEFHYTSPLKPSPTHRILYGAELEPYIFGELIAANLVRQSKIEPTFLITDQPLVLSQRPSSSCAIICVTTDSTTRNSSTEAEQPAPEMKAHPNYSQDLDALTKWKSETNPGLDLREPFARLWEALREVVGAEAKQVAA